MKIYILLSTIILFSCNQKQSSSLKKILSEDVLASQIFYININRDTTLVTRDGCIIKIPKGSLESDSNNVKLDIKEALTSTEIALAGLTTQSNKQTLSSGGMIYFNAANGYRISIKKSLEILVPTNTYNRDMKVYKGEKESNGKINWKEPQELPKDSTSEKINVGEKLFKSNCANCHKIYDEFTGPALYGVTDRRSKKWLYDYTRHASEMSGGEPQSKSDSSYYYSYDPYAICLTKRYGTVMTSFPVFSNDGLDAIYSYIKSESDKRPDLKNNVQQTCCDSCEAYRKKLNQLNFKKEDLINENGNFFSLNREIPIPPVASVSSGSVIADTTYPPYSKVTPGSASAVYYTINITTVGWYNIDILMKDFSACQPSELFVRLQGSYKIDLNVVLIIPSVKVFVEGAKLKDGKQYGFDEDNGKIPLPQNQQAFILAFGEYENKIIFGKTIFNTQTKQAINVTVEESTKEKLRSEIKAFNLDNVNTNIRKSKNVDKIIETNMGIKEAEKLKPKNCDCGLPNTQPLIPTK